MTIAPLKLSVPATAANLGPGFDRLGLALNLRMNVTAHPATSWQVTLRGEGSGELPDNSENLIVQQMRRSLAEFGAPQRPYKLQINNPIPISRGLGSSAAAIVTGVGLAQLAAWGRLDKQALFATAAESEGHPDNVAPAVFGGLCDCPKGSETVLHPPISEAIQVLLLIPSQRVATKNMRKVLPTTYLPQVLSANHLACDRLLRGLAKGDAEGLRASQDDQMHQPYRLAAQPLSNQIYQSLCHHEAIAGAFLSGSGPTVAGWVLQEDINLEGIKDNFPPGTRMLVERVDREGTLDDHREERDERRR